MPDKHGWISVNEALPDLAPHLGAYSADCYVVIKGKTDVVDKCWLERWDEGKWLGQVLWMSDWVGAFVARHEVVTHWQYMPTKPPLPEER